MLNKYLIPLLTTALLNVPLFPALGQVSTASEIVFSCEDNREIPLTIATNNAGETQTIFSWKQELFSDYVEVKTICNNVAEKLNNYVAQGHDLSLFILQPDRQAGLPTICATETGMNCDLVLLTLAPNEEPIEKACETLKAILSHEISEPIFDNSRSISIPHIFAIALFDNTP